MKANFKNALISAVLAALVVLPIFGLHLERKGTRTYIEPHWNLVIWGFVIVLVLQSVLATAWRAAARSGWSSGRAWYMGAKPAATSSALRSRRGTDRRSARRSTISRLGCARPVST